MVYNKCPLYKINLTYIFRLKNYTVYIRKVEVRRNLGEPSPFVRKTTKTIGAFVSDKVVDKLIYLAILNAQIKWEGTMFGKRAVRRELDTYYNERFYQNDTVN